MHRKINKYFIGRPAVDGAGVNLYRTFGNSDIPEFDPFLMMDFFDSSNPEDYTKGFPWHPHRGIETITYLIEGEIEHEDSLGNKGVIRAGDCQWMSAGSGILHQEMPQASQQMLGVQIWLNLSKDEKMSEPKYRDITKGMIPIYEGKDYKVHIIAGELEGLKGELENTTTQPSFFDVELNKDSEFIYKIDPSFNAYAFLVRGEAVFDEESEKSISYPNGVLYKQGDSIKVKTGEKPARFLLLTGKKLNEPVAWGGPIVMNTKEELDIAFRDIKEGIFIKNK
jgi:redox-sensitive bicupin YhaK (pirin superfamily)